MFQAPTVNSTDVFLQLILDLWGWRCWHSHSVMGVPLVVYLWTSSPLGVGGAAVVWSESWEAQPAIYLQKCLFPTHTNPWNPAGSLTMRTIPKKTEENRDCFSKKNRQPEKYGEQVVFPRRIRSLILTGSDKIRSQYSRNDPFSKHHINQNTSKAENSANVHWIRGKSFQQSTPHSPTKTNKNALKTCNYI